MILTAVQAGSRWDIEAHNLTEKTVKATIKGAVKFRPLANLQQNVEIAAGSSKTIAVS